MGRRLACIGVQLPGAPLGGNGAAIKRGERPAQSLGVVSTYSAALAAVWGESATRSASAAHTRKGCSVTPPKKRGGGPAPRGGSNVPRKVAGGQGALSAAGEGWAPRRICPVALILRKSGGAAAGTTLTTKERRACAKGSPRSS